METYIISDTHFGDPNIIFYENRPFNSVKEMNETIIKNWNKTIAKEDIVFFLGDVAVGYNSYLLKELIKDLSGYKILIMGNHDKKYSPETWKKIGFSEICKYPIIYNEFYIFSHEPLYLNKNMPYRNVHGHLHSNMIQNKDSRLYYNVSVEQINYTPINFEVIQKYFLYE